MKFFLQITATLLVGISGASGQLLSSHSSTLPATQPAAPVSAAPVMTSVQVTGKAVAKVNGTVLTDRDLLREMFALFPYAKLHNGFPKGQEAEIRRGAMQMIVFEELVYQDAVHRKMAVSAQRIQDEVTKFKKQFSSQAEYAAYLKTDSDGSEAKLRQQIKRTLLINDLLKQEVDKKAIVTEADARAYYDTNPKRFEHGETFTIQSISILPPANANADTLKDARKRAESILAEAKKTKNYEEFGLLAEKSSDDDFRVNMGDHHVVAREKLPQEIVQVLAKMKTGEVTDLIQLGSAYTIVRLNAHELPGTTQFSDIKSDLMTQLRKQKYEQTRVAFDRQLREKASIQEL